ncbi:TRAP transporter small permease [Candidatus Halocynthiibacter alkanivorans]|jgi:TRAP-type transport system small permease protein|uniref:TRAP transporter small permease n=1 Tax=Candidatus Halocynthiibacter alkanivorans TaxID=2267619 RepID=UPI001F298D1D|nr:TRAP transporter small permease [Candidatus Halocynthiibacter alkanivorans]
MSINRMNSLAVRFCRLGICLAFSVLIAAVLLQVLGRTFGSSPVWTEELTRYALLYLAAFGVGLSLRSGELVNVDVFCEALPGNWPWRLRVFSTTTTVVICLVLLGPAWKYTSIGARQTSPAMGLRMDFVHASILIMLVFLLIFAALRLAAMLLNGDTGLPQKPDGDA